jgi:hypothetical protein
MARGTQISQVNAENAGRLNPIERKYPWSLLKLNGAGILGDRFWLKADHIKYSGDGCSRLWRIV